MKSVFMGARFCSLKLLLKTHIVMLHEQEGPGRGMELAGCEFPCGIRSSRALPVLTLIWVLVPSAPCLHWVCVNQFLLQFVFSAHPL